MILEPGTRFGRLVVKCPGPTKPNGKKKHGRATSVCTCDCGNEVVVTNHELRCGDTLSCGCFHKERARAMFTKHGDRDSRLYHIWKGMRTRCTNERRAESDRYVLRGIRVCSEWSDYSKFKEWSLAHGYSDDLTIDRIDNDKGYSPDNCRWTTYKEQASNKSNTYNFEYAGHKFRTIKELAAYYGMNYRTVQNRVHRGWSLERTINQKVRRSTNAKRQNT